MQSLLKMLAQKQRENAARGCYNPILPGFGSVLNLLAGEYLEAFGQVQDNESKKRVPFRTDTVNGRLTNSILNYIDDPGYDANGRPFWDIEVSGRQSTKSTSATYGLYTVAARQPGTEAFILADTNDRARYLYHRALELHTYLPDRIRPTLGLHGVSRALTFDPDVGGSLSFYSAERRGGMVGFSGKVGQVSEIPFMQDPAKTLSVLLPSMYHQSESRLILESTPAPPSFNGAEYWKNLVTGTMEVQLKKGKKNKSRFKVNFSPFWESKLNSLIWDEDEVLTNAEIDLLNQYGHLGLTRENLAFRRSIIATDEEIRRNPDLFDVWYPSSLLTCWGGGNVGLFPSNVLKGHLGAENSDRLAPFPCESHRTVIIGVDPAGLLGGADHAAFSVLACDQTDWVLQEQYSDCVTVHEVVDELLETAERYQKITGSWPWIAVESNGVGAATLALLIKDGYTRLYSEAKRKVGIVASKKANARMVAETCDALMDKLQPLWSLPMVSQLQSYTGDRDKKTTELSTLINGLAKGRRTRNHWDLASSFMLAIDAANNIPMPRAPVREVPVHLAPRPMTAEDYDKIRALDAAAERRKRRRR